MLKRRYKSIDHILVVMASLDDGDIESARTYLEYAAEEEDLDDALSELNESQEQKKKEDEDEEDEEKSIDELSSVVEDNYNSMWTRQKALSEIAMVLTGETSEVTREDVRKYCKHIQRASVTDHEFEAEDLDWGDEEEETASSVIIRSKTLNHAKQTARNLASIT